ncbi:hypothetical protein O0I10_000142 [Lichtheimia ornata]|uniref:MFS-type drug efflux transporter P55 n=1 Tax=Lichtheimia ornata TaxID=688661 RepID=A0AAD7Y523_9FUNG|nr:uncharacterized protein O0I10_000142 [Lichtheimia ornata]KAJ8663867.1 hypothetical protein O0I10_000142 [Lichtheimia ornata]
MSGNKNEEQPFLQVRDNDNAPNTKTSSYNTISTTSPPSKNNQTSKDDTNKEHQNIELGSVSIGILTLCLAVSAALPTLDVSICFTIMSEIGTEFEKAHLATWIHNSYILACMTTLPLAGKLADLFGRKPVLVVLTLLFLLGSYGCGISQNLAQIIVARAIAGFGGGGVTLMANVVIHDVISIDKRSQYQSFISMVQTLGIAVGSPLGGFITDTFGWRYCFKLNIIPLLFNAYIYFFRLNNYRTPSMVSNGTKIMDQLRSIDFLGVILLSAANSLLVTSFLFGGNTYEWDDPLTICLLIGSGLAFILFGLHQAYGTRHPLISHTLATNRNAVVTCAGMIFMCICESGLSYSLPQFFMGVLGFTTSESGLWTMAEALIVPVGCFTAGQYIRRTGYFKKFVFVIGALYVVGCGSSSQWMIRALPFFVGMFFVIIQGFSYGAILVSLFMSVARDLPGYEMASAMSIAVLFRYMGFSLGPASVAAIVQGNLKSLLTEKITGSDAEELIKFIRTSIRKTYTLSPELQEIVADALGKSLQKAFFLMTGSMLIATCVFLLLKNINLKAAAAAQN